MKDLLHVYLAGPQITAVTFVFIFNTCINEYGAIEITVTCFDILLLVSVFTWLPKSWVSYIASGEFVVGCICLFVCFVLFVLVFCFLSICFTSFFVFCIRANGEPQRMETGAG